MQTLAEMTTEVSGLIGRDDSFMTTRIKAALNRRYQEIINSGTFFDFTQETSFTATSGLSEFGLPQRVRGVFSLYKKGESRPFRASAMSRMVDRYVETIGDSAFPVAYSRMATKPIQIMPTAATAITITSSETDSGLNLRVIGFNGDLRQSESVAIGGTTSKNYTDVTQVAKDAASQGDLTIAANSVTIGQISALDRNSQYQWVRFNTAFPDDNTVRVVYDGVPDRLIDDEDAPRFDIGYILVNGAFVDALKINKKHQQASVQEGKYQAILNDWITKTFAEDGDFSAEPDEALLRNHNRNLMRD